MNPLKTLFQWWYPPLPKETSDPEKIYGIQEVSPYHPTSDSEENTLVVPEIYLRIRKIWNSIELHFTLEIKNGGYLLHSEESPITWWPSWKFPQSVGPLLSWIAETLDLVLEEQDIPFQVGLFRDLIEIHHQENREESVVLELSKYDLKRAYFDLTEKMEKEVTLKSRNSKAIEWWDDLLAEYQED